MRRAMNVAPTYSPSTVTVLGKKRQFTDASIDTIKSSFDSCNNNPGTQYPVGSVWSCQSPSPMQTSDRSVRQRCVNDRCEYDSSTATAVEVDCRGLDESVSTNLAGRNSSCSPTRVMTPASSYASSHEQQQQNHTRSTFLSFGQNSNIIRNPISTSLEFSHSNSVSTLRKEPVRSMSCPDLHALNQIHGSRIQ